MTPNREDYLKLILELGGDKTKVSNKKIVAGLNVSPASVSEMLSKLVKEDLVEHTPYQGVELTPKGLHFASSLIRKHRLWEVFLVDKLNYSFNDVHEEAEVLEHVTSDALANHLYEFLEQPEFCPHGGKIPKFNEELHEVKRKNLTEYKKDTKIRIARILDEKDLLDYLVDLNLNLHDEFYIKDVAPLEGPITLTNHEKTITIGNKAASTIFVETLEED